jgi:hypothetical protein
MTCCTFLHYEVVSSSPTKVSLTAYSVYPKLTVIRNLRIHHAVVTREQLICTGLNIYMHTLQVAQKLHKNVSVCECEHVNLYYIVQNMHKDVYKKILIISVDLKHRNTFFILNA